MATPEQDLSGIAISATGLSDALTLEDLQDLQAAGLDFLYDLEPMQAGLFALVNFQDFSSSEFTSNNVYKLSNTAFRVQSVSFNDAPEFSFTTDPITRMPTLNDVKFDRNLTISYVEDVYHSIRKYHKDWMLKWYNPSMDVVRNGSQGKLRGCDIVVYHYVDSDSSSVLSSLPKVEPIMVYCLRGIVPKKLPQLKFDMKANKAIEMINIEYTFSRLVVRYNQDWFKEWGGEKDDASTNYSKVKSDAPTIWNPESLAQSDTAAAFSYEGPRIARSLYPTLAGEGEA